MNTFLEVPYPVFTTVLEDDTPIPARQTTDSHGFIYDVEESTKEDVYGWFTKMADLFPSQPYFDILRTYLKPVCPESLVDNFSLQWYRIEAAVKEYGVASLSLPNYLFSGFEIIRGAENTFENIENLKREQEIKSKK